ncbi:class I SAM-dependent methyltransferase [Leptospira terpstrae]|uniref:Methyltransferase domain protein n=1 Tax=Leptospira terpstrae serovar Hualin str. LT 11-33 = ATCC 700639 TaxID=1257025 RepID=N1VMF0_9LEPT|nr:class I SAM-dependent methyltransferase [Leptospira terpstrae]EMY60839.1 methyltransferase domain protein [Leptospira terpstrae serovar Hualin str. LT 11-33 = ATCC 700639]
MDQAFWPNEETEKLRYIEHNNDVYDTRYQSFLKPIVEKVIRHQKVSDKGLDYGAGPGPVVQYLLEQEGFKIKLYDPFFQNYPENLKQTYDFIILTEVVEHFHSPKKEFQKLANLLEPGGSLYILTYPYNDSINFESWYYKNDRTHTFFYTAEAFEWICEHYSFRKLDIEGRIIRLQI